LLISAALSTDVVTGPLILNNFYLSDSRTIILFSGLDSSSLLLAASHLDEVLASLRCVSG
jgi:hypothetical protein